ncbi:hypothetical protein SAVIM338S_03522 [Streptomyces avidinii]
MPGPALCAPRVAALFWAPLIALAPAPAAPAATLVAATAGTATATTPTVDTATVGSATVGTSAVGTSTVSAVPAPARASPVGTADGPGDIALAIGATTAAAAATGLWLRSRYRREDADAVESTEGGDP